MSIVRIGLGEDDKFGDGYEAIFGKKPEKGATAKKPEAKQPEAKKPEAKKPAPKKK